MFLELMVSVMPVNSWTISADVNGYKHRLSGKIIVLYHAALNIHQWCLSASCGFDFAISTFKQEDQNQPCHFCVCTCRSSTKCNTSHGWFLGTIIEWVRVARNSAGK